MSVRHPICRVQRRRNYRCRLVCEPADLIALHLVFKPALVLPACVKADWSPTRKSLSATLGTMLFHNDLWIIHTAFRNRITNLFMTLLNTSDEADSTCRSIIRNFIKKLRRASSSRSSQKDSADKYAAGPSTRRLKRPSSSTENTQYNKRKKLVEEEIYDHKSVSKHLCQGSL